MKGKEHFSELYAPSTRPCALAIFTGAGPVSLALTSSLLHGITLQHQAECIHSQKQHLQITTKITQCGELIL
jgi:hypothetical protein